MLQPTRTLQKGIRQYEHMPLRCSGIFKLEKERRPRVANIEILQARGGNCDGQLHSATTNVPDAGHSETLSHRVAPSTYGDANYHVACVRHQQWDMTRKRSVIGRGQHGRGRRCFVDCEDGAKPKLADECSEGEEHVGELEECMYGL
ncbi:uncharacterized protein MELLADRAFT_107273 [Melampsora larici-populina 98AG31]|uniref:Uncharacterized protein n=1 Tax=Melampsora larici-populina (strain 98AG31 / pathotype 3-4-7) TaxID=747676 RepID=F4RPE4_MELLP|nr:uncharacterized protein MELLADRAFT_107273 [Melampsora larici-populina 98AG31]EGG05861.1 hypothetical protein MELLADRAFT_107273 [Melampsora larici-populina 98AG31]